MKLEVIVQLEVTVMLWHVSSSLVVVAHLVLPQFQTQSKQELFPHWLSHVCSCPHP